MPRSPAKHTTKESITSMPATDIKDELTRAIWTTFQLEGIVTTLAQEKTSQDEFKGEIRQKFDTINNQLSALPDKYVTKQELSDRLKPIEDDVKSTNGNITWGVRIVIGAVITALLGIVIVSRTGGL